MNCNTTHYRANSSSVPGDPTELAAERAASLASYRVADPALLAARRAAFEAAGEPAERRRTALELARLCDDALDKDGAFSWVERAVGADPAGGDAEGLEAARWIAADRIAVFGELTGARVAALASRFSASPLVRAMEEELTKFRAREAKRLSGYLFR